MPHAHRRIDLAVAALVLLGCEPGTVTLAEPGQRSGTVARDTLFVHVTVDSVDVSLRDSLQWGAGVPNAEVRLLRKGEGEWLSGFTDSIGVAAFERILPGTYRLYAQRILESAEADRAGGVIRAFGDGRTVELAGSQTIDLRLIADRPASLVISEFGPGAPPPWEVGGSSTFEAGYLEIYNNADTTLYLDGLLFVSTPFIYESSVPTPCSMSRPVRTDPGGVYARAALAFPGSGSDYPMESAETQTIAMVAIDHRPTHPALNDLSNADFEIGLPEFGDNPAVPNMLSVGLEVFYPQYLFALRNVVALSLPVDLQSLPILFRDGNGRGWVRVPRSRLLDVTVFRSIWPLRDGEEPWCIPMVSPALNRYEGGFVEIGFDVDEAFGAVRSLHRRFLRRDPTGRLILMNTHTTAVDFVHDLKSPGRVPTDSLPFP